MSRATRASWKNLPAPMEKESLGFEALFSDADADLIQAGLIPAAMEDKWFIFFEDGWLHFCRSWTGAQIYGVRLDGSPAGVRVIDSWVNRDPQQYKGDNVAYDRELLGFLIDALLLKKNVSFPMPPGSQQTPSGVVQHSTIGRSYPEHASKEEK